MDDAQVAELMKAGDLLEPELRRVGVYVDNTNIVEFPDGTPVLVIDAYLGNVAFSKRVQDPEQHDFDREFKKMTFGTVADDFLDARGDLERRIAEGKPILGGDDESV